MADYKKISAQAEETKSVIAAIQKGMVALSASVQNLLTTISVNKADLESYQKTQRTLRRSKIVSLGEWAEIKRLIGNMNAEIAGRETQLQELKTIGTNNTKKIHELEAQLKGLETELAGFGRVIPFKRP